jgi:hypothetical protein
MKSHKRTRTHFITYSLANHCISTKKTGTCYPQKLAYPQKPTKPKLYTRNMIRHWNAITSHKQRKDWYTSTGIVLTRWWLWQGSGGNSVLGLILSTFYSIFLLWSFFRSWTEYFKDQTQRAWWVIKTRHVWHTQRRKTPNGVETLTTLFTHKEQGVCHTLKKYFKAKE